MLNRSKFVFAILFLISAHLFAQSNDREYSDIYNLIENKDFFKATQEYEKTKNELSQSQQEILNALLSNAFNKLIESNRQIDLLISRKTKLPDSLLVKLYKVKTDNYIKQFEYKNAKQNIETIIRDFGKILSQAEMEDMENSLKIWSALENKPKQWVIIPETNRLKMGVDKAGLKTLQISNPRDSVDFIFDTGANLCTVTESTAKRFDMEILSADIKVGSITGKSTLAKLAICSLMRLGSINIHNAVFLVFKDEDLNFSQIDYQINGILGYPVIAALREIKIEQDGFFMVPKEETKTNFPSNLAMDELTPIIFIDGMHFTFDTGADHTIFYFRYFIENKTEIEQNYKSAKFRFAGAGGMKEFEGYIITKNFMVQNTKISVEGIQVLKEEMKDLRGVYGNIGQDFIRKFNSMTMNFDHMFISFN